MKYIHFVLLSLFIVLTLFVTPVCGTEVNAMIHYSEKFVGPKSEFTLEQGYSIKVIDSSPVDGMSMIELYLNGNKIDTDMQFASEYEPFEYIKTVKDDDDDDDAENEKDYLIIRITPIDVIEEPLSVKFKTEQFIDPKLDALVYLILDTSKSIKVGMPLELEEDYTLEASDLKDETVTLTLSKNGFLVKEEEDVEIGDMFTYCKIVNGEAITIFIAKLDNLFVGTDSETVFFKQVSQRVDIVTESDATIIVEGSDRTKLRAGDIAIIRYTFETSDISEVIIMLDGEQIDIRKDVGAGSYSTVTEKLDAGTHEIMINAVSEDGTRSTHTKMFTVESSIASEVAELAAEVVSDATSGPDKIDDGNETVDKMFGVPGFGSLLSVVIIGFVFISMRKRNQY